MFNWNGDLQLVSGNSINVEPIGLVVGALGFIQGWKITVDDGTTFTFQAIETTEVSLVKKDLNRIGTYKHKSILYNTLPWRE